MNILSFAAASESTKEYSKAPDEKLRGKPALRSRRIRKSAAEISLCGSSIHSVSRRPQTAESPPQADEHHGFSAHCITWRKKNIQESLVNVLFIMVLFVFASPATAEAQPRLDAFQVINSWPMIFLESRPSCNGVRVFLEDAHLLSVRENGKDIRTYKASCGDPGKWGTLSLAMVIDESSHMQSQGINEAKQDVSSMLLIMDSANDEASIRSFRDSTALYHGMTSSGDSLRRLISQLHDSGKAMLFDAVYAGIEDAAANGRKNIKAVLVLASGRDDGSKKSLDSCVALAIAKRIRVFSIGLGNDIRDSALRALGHGTGGRYFETPNPSQLVSIYQELTTVIIGDDNCIVMYETSCMDGERRTVELTLRDTCGGSARESGSYTALLDLSIPSLSLRVEERSVSLRERVDIPIHIDASELGDTIPPFRCTILFMDALLHLDTVVAPKGSLLETVPFVFTRIQGGVELKSTAPVLVTGHVFPAKLADLRFTVLQASLRDTLRCPLVFSSWVFDTGCYRTARTNGEVIILPSGPTSVSAMPDADAWMDIYPEPNAGSFTVRLRLDAPQAITMRVRNVLGQIVHETSRVKGQGARAITIALDNSPAGVYLLEAVIGAHRLIRTIRVAR